MCCEQHLVLPLKLNCIHRPRGTAEFVMKNHCVRLVDNTESQLPQPDAIIGILVIRRFESLVKAAELFPYRPPGQKQSGGTVVHIAPEHIHGSERIVASSIPEART